jgi:pimeloyl-ACP methyl ester carboxylesterase
MMLNLKSEGNKTADAIKRKNQVNQAWTGMLPVDDTALYVTDTGGSGIPVIYLNGQFATRDYWSKVIEELGSDFRHITYDERARGRKSGTSSDYSFAACVRDVDAVLAARGIRKCVVIGWSYGAFIAAHWASLNPDHCYGAVLVDGAQPYDWITPDMTKRIRKLFRLLNPVMWLLRPTGITPRLSASKMAEINIELGWLASKKELDPVVNKITVPTLYVLASGSSLGSKGDEQELIRAGVNEVVERNPNIRIKAKVKSNHDHILKKDFLAVADAVREIVTLNNLMIR